MSTFNFFGLSNTSLWLTCGILVLCTVFLLWIFIRRQVRVNCWFCNSFCYVARVNRNSWECPQCQQYNGFLKNGDYNKLIPAHSRSNFNPSSRAVVAASFPTESDILCGQCTRNQATKIKLLAQFEAVNSSQWEEEMDNFQAQLERSCALCFRCQRRAQERIRQCDVAVLPKYVEWHKQKAPKRGLYPSSVVISIHRRFIRKLFYVSLYCNFIVLVVLVSFEFKSTWTVFSYTMTKFKLTSHKLRCIFICMSSVLGTIHLLSNCYFAFLNTSLIVSLGIGMSLVADLWIPLKFPPSVCRVSEILCLIISFAALFTRLPPHLLYPKRRQTMRHSSKPTITNMRRFPGDQDSIVSRTSWDSQTSSPTRPLSPDNNMDRDQEDTEWDSLSQYSIHPSDRNPFYLSRQPSPPPSVSNVSTVGYRSVYSEPIVGVNQPSLLQPARFKPPPSMVHRRNYPRFQQSSLITGAVPLTTDSISVHDRTHATESIYAPSVVSSRSTIRSNNIVPNSSPSPVSGSYYTMRQSPNGNISSKLSPSSQTSLPNEEDKSSNCSWSDESLGVKHSPPPNLFRMVFRFILGFSFGIGITFVIHNYTEFVFSYFQKLVMSVF